MDSRTLLEPTPDVSWSETTTPTSEDIDETIRTPHSFRRPGSLDSLSQPHGAGRLSGPRMPPGDPQESGVTRCHPVLEFPNYNIRCSMDSSVSPTSAVTFITSAGSSATDSWSSPGFVEGEEQDEGSRDAEGEDDLSDSHEAERYAAYEEDILAEPKLEPEEDVNMLDIAPAAGLTASPPVKEKRGRGRPRKHPIPTPEEKARTRKMGRTKTGCITCRRRKKKCDEEKPECKNCVKNGVKCQGYNQPTIWKSGKEKMEERNAPTTCQHGTDELSPTINQLHRASISTKKLPPMIPGLDDPIDMIFFEHYYSRMSTKFTVEVDECNAFRDILVPMAVHHSGLMHSILALSSNHIDFSSDYGKSVLKDHPEITLQALQERSVYHKDAAMADFVAELARVQSNPDGAISPPALGQMLCFLLQSQTDSNLFGERRLHLSKYLEIKKECPPKDAEFLKFVDEIFRYHIFVDELISLPHCRLLPSSDAYDWQLPTTLVQSDAVRLLGVSDGLFYYLSEITTLRNAIRKNMQDGVDPAVNAHAYWKAAQIRNGLIKWKPSWPEGDSRDLAGDLYRKMIWVYLYRTIYPPRSADWKINSDLTEVVSEGIAMLENFAPRDPSQTLLLAPAFVLGCAAFDPAQREPICKAIRVVKNYLELRNTEAALSVLRRVWKLMDDHDEKSWDWQTIAAEANMDFLAT